MLEWSEWLIAAVRELRVTGCAAAIFRLQRRLGWVCEMSPEC
jgi:hypothetical protein